MRAGSLEHGVPCRGYCYEHFDKDGGKRKITIFGDTCNSESMYLNHMMYRNMKPLVANSDVLVHEATYGPILSDLDRSLLHQDLTNWKQIQDEVLMDERNQRRWDELKKKALYTCHSSCEMVGRFASEIHAKAVILTHLGSRYDCKSERTAKAIQYLLKEQVGLYFDGLAVTAYDGFQFMV